MKKKFYSMLLCICMCANYVLAQSPTTITVSTPGTLSQLLGEDRITVSHLIVTGTIDVTDFQTIKEMTKLTVLDLQNVNITDNKIPSGAFQSKAYEELILPNSLQIIGKTAFASSNIKKVIIPESVTFFDHQCFNNANIDGVDFSRCHNVKTMDTYIFRNVNSAIIDLTPFTSLETIGSFSFIGSTSRVILPKHLTKIDTNVFNGARLKELILPNSLQIIGNAAFVGSNIKKMIIPESVTFFDHQCFSGANIDGVDFSQCRNVKTIDSYVFRNITKPTIDLSGFTSLETMGTNCFDATTSEVILPKHLRTKTFKGQFWGFKGSVKFDEGLLKLETRCFSAANMEELILPNSLQIIGDAAFVGSNIKKMIIPESVTFFDHQCFSGANIDGVDFSQCRNVKTIDSYVFRNITKPTIDLSGFTSLETMGTNCFDATTSEVILPKHLRTKTFKGQFWGFKGSVKFDEGLLKLETRCFSAANMEELILPNSLQIIGDAAFVGSNIKKVIIPESVTFFDHQCFSGANIDGVDFSQCRNVKTIDSYVFRNITNTTIDLSGFTSLETMGTNSFDATTSEVILPKHLRTKTFKGQFWGFKGSVKFDEGLLKLETRCFSAANMEELILPNSLQIIGDAAFVGSNIKKVIIPESVTFFDHQCFSDANIDGVDFSQCRNVKTIDSYVFRNVVCNTLDLSGLISLETMGVNSFDGSKASTIILPENLKYIGANSFVGCSKLVKLQSLNPIPPSLGSNVFAGIDKSTCVLEVPAGSLHLYAEADQWKDFFNIIPAVLPEVDLRFRIPTAFSLFHRAWCKNLNVVNISGAYAEYVEDPDVTTLIYTVDRNEQMTFYATENIGAVTVHKAYGKVEIGGSTDMFNSRYTKTFERKNNRYEFTDGVGNYGGGVTFIIVFPAGYTYDDLYRKGLVIETNRFDGTNVKIPSSQDTLAVDQTYKGVRIGEYYWMDNNFNYEQPYDYLMAPWNLHPSTLEWNAPINKSYLQTYFPRANMSANYADSLDIEAFKTYYGGYYARRTLEYQAQNGVMYEGSNAVETGWSMPSSEDYRQLFAMCSVNSEGILLPGYVITDLACRVGDNPVAKTLGTAPNWIYWFEGRSNKYGFNMMPGGSRAHANGVRWTNSFSTQNGYPAGWPAIQGDFMYLFYTASFATTKGQVLIHDFIDASPHPEVMVDQPSYSFQNSRWCRKLTDQELGYKLYIQANNQWVTDSNEWITLKAGDEAPLLRTLHLEHARSITDAGYNCHFNFEDFNIMQTGLDAVPSADWIELPNGYIRGFYVQYILDQTDNGVTDADVVRYATQVLDGGLDPYKHRNDPKPYPWEANPALKNTTGMETDFLTAGISIYPNPVQDILNVDSPEPVVSLTIFNTFGSIVKVTENVDNGIDVSNLPSGAYLIRVETAKDVYNSKIMKK